jgi:tetratricopeptide (TPR) repeat protein
LPRFQTDGFELALQVLREDLLSEGYVSVAQESASMLLKEPAWAAHLQSQELLAIVLEYYSRASISPAAFDHCDPYAREGEICGYADALSRLQTSAHPELKEAIEDIVRAYRWDRVGNKGEYGRITSESYAQALFPGWSSNEEYARLFSQLLANVANFYQLDKNYDDALALLSSAWLLYRGNTASAVQTAAILSADPDRFDPDGKLVEKLTSAYAIRRTGTYSALGGDRPIELEKSRENLENLGQIFSYLYEISAKRNKGILFTTPKAYRSKYHAAQAARAIEFLRQEEPTSARNQAWLGRVLEQEGQQTKAAENYLRAARTYTGSCEWEHAREQLEAVQRVMPAPKRRNLEDFNEVSALVEKSVCVVRR